MTIRYEYPARGEMPPVSLTWYQGRKSPRVETDQVPAWDTGFLFVGDQGMLLADYTRRVLLPAAKFAGYKPPEPTHSGLARPLRGMGCRLQERAAPRAATSTTPAL